MGNTQVAHRYFGDPLTAGKAFGVMPIREKINKICDVLENMVGVNGTRIHKPTVGGWIVDGASGASGVSGASLEITTEDTDTVKFKGKGTEEEPLKADAVTHVFGLLTPEGELNHLFIGAISLSGTGTELDPVVGSLQIDPDWTNMVDLETDNGLYVPPPGQDDDLHWGIGTAIHDIEIAYDAEDDVPVLRARQCTVLVKRKDNPPELDPSEYEPQPLDIDDWFEVIVPEKYNA